jgi:hypothetical protein
VTGFAASCRAVDSSVVQVQGHQTEMAGWLAGWLFSFALCSLEGHGTTEAKSRKGNILYSVQVRCGRVDCLTACARFLCTALHVSVVILVTFVWRVLLLCPLATVLLFHYCASVPVCTWMASCSGETTAALSFAAVGYGILYVVRRLAWRVADTDTCHRKGVYAMCCAEAIEIRTVRSNNWHCSDKNYACPCEEALSRERKSRFESMSARLRGGRRPRSLQPCISTLNRSAAATRKNVRGASVTSDIEPLCLYFA